MYLKDKPQNPEARHKRPHIVYFHLYELSRKQIYRQRVN